MGSFSVVAPGMRSARPKLVFTARSFWFTVYTPAARQRTTNQAMRPIRIPREIPAPIDSFLPYCRASKIHDGWRLSRRGKLSGRRICTEAQDSRPWGLEEYPTFQ